jgi:hypothetical protein
LIEEKLSRCGCLPMAPKGAELLAAVTRAGRQVREFFAVANGRNLPEPAVFDRLKWPVPAGFRPAINQGPAPQIRTAQEAARIEIRNIMDAMRFDMPPLRFGGR